jgi:molybdopterin-guanine dinucleotide biosynthesis protein A
MTDLYGLVLAGGKSKRMGTDKGLISFRGVPHREYLFELLRGFTEKVYTSCRVDQQVPREFNPLFDQFGFDGPLNGILSAFATAPYKAWLIVATDMPYVDASVLQFLLDNRDKNKLATAFWNEEQKFPEPLLTIWETKTFSLLQAFVAIGKISPKSFLETHPVHLVSPSDPKWLLSVNYPHQLPGGSSN